MHSWLIPSDKRFKTCFLSCFDASSEKPTMLILVYSKTYMFFTFTFLRLICFFSSFSLLKTSKAASLCVLESMLDSCIFLPTPQSLISKCVLVFVYTAIAVLLCRRKMECCTWQICFSQLIKMYFYFDKIL